MRHIWAVVAVAAIFFASSGMALAQADPGSQQTQAADPPPQGDHAGDAARLATKLSNPIADLISVPIQANYDCCFGNTNASRWLTNLQPVVPISISNDWNVIIRTILPIISQQVSPIQSIGGIGDTLQSFFFSPKEPTSWGLIWGAGPALLYPTGTNGFSANQWAGGPTVVALKQEHGWTYGMLVNQIWSFGNGGPLNTVNQLFMQPFVGYTTRTGFTVTLESETSHDWTNDTWTAPVNLLFSQVFKVEGQPLSFEAGPRYYFSTPHGGPRWGARIELTLLFPE